MKMQLCKCGCLGLVKTKGHHYCPGHNNQKGRTIPQEQKNKISVGMKQLFILHPEMREQRRKEATGKKHSVKSKKVMSEKAKKREHWKRLRHAFLKTPLSNLTEEGRKRISKAIKGRPVSKQTRQLISKANKGRQISSNERRMRSRQVTEYYKTHPGTFTGKTHSSKTIRKIKQKQKEFYKTHHGPWYGKKRPIETRRKMSIGRKGKCKDSSNPNWNGGSSKKTVPCAIFKSPQTRNQTKG